MSCFPASPDATEDLHSPTQEYSVSAASRRMAVVVSLGIHCSCPELSRRRSQLFLACPSHWPPLGRTYPRARAADQMSFANGLVTSSRARKQVLQVRPGCLVSHRRQWFCRAGETRARRSRRDFGERQRRDYGVGDSTARFSMGLSRDERCGCALHMGVTKVCPDEQEDRWRAGWEAWRPFIPTIRR